MTAAKNLQEPQAVDKIFAVVRNALPQLGIHPAQYHPRNNFKKLPDYVGEPLRGEGNNAGYVLDVIERVLSAPK